MATIFSGVGGAFLYYSSDFVANANEVSGIVVDVSVNRNDGTTTYKPTVSYVDLNGVKQTGQTFLSSSGYNFPRGSKINILYDPRDPSRIRMNSWFSLWGFPMVFLGVGLLLALIALIVALRIKKKKPDAIGESSNLRKPAKTYSYSSSEASEKHPPIVRRR